MHAQKLLTASTLNNQHVERKNNCMEMMRDVSMFSWQKHFNIVDRNKILSNTDDREIWQGVS